ncbi:MAG: hypothetical protein EOP06_31655, partial [Proteobacteria bacterium]
MISKKHLSLAILLIELGLIYGAWLKLASIRQNVASEVRNLWEVDKHFFLAFKAADQTIRDRHLEAIH